MSEYEQEIAKYEHEWTKYVRVDVVLECYDVSTETSQELLKLMPDAYGGDAPGEDDWPEPDHPRDAKYILSNVWDKLSAEAKIDIEKNK